MASGLHLGEKMGGGGGSSTGYLRGMCRLKDSACKCNKQANYTPSDIFKKSNYDPENTLNCSYTLRGGLCGEHAPQKRTLIGAMVGQVTSSMVLCMAQVISEQKHKVNIREGSQKRPGAPGHRVLLFCQPIAAMTLNMIQVFGGQFSILFWESVSPSNSASTGLIMIFKYNISGSKKQRS